MDGVLGSQEALLGEVTIPHLSELLEVADHRGFEEEGSVADGNSLLVHADVVLLEGHRYPEA